MMEGASFLLLDHAKTTYKTLDLLDFYVEHLSWYERRLLVAGPGGNQRSAFEMHVLGMQRTGRVPDHAVEISAPVRGRSRSPRRSRRRAWAATAAPRP